MNYKSMLDANIHHFEQVNTHELKQGDIIRHCGMIIKVGEKKVSNVFDDKGYGVTEFHMSEILFSRPDMPQPGTRQWNVQGNRLAKWSKWIG